MPMQNAVADGIVLARAIEVERRTIDRMGWVDRPGDAPSAPLPGTAVRVRGLTRRDELNGASGFVLNRKADEQGRLTIRVPAPGGAPPREYRVRPAYLERAVGRSRSAPALPPARGAPPLTAGHSNVSTAAPAASAPSVPPGPIHPGFVPTRAFDVHKISGQGRGYLRQKSGGFFAM
mmetsp:Transcript_4720/g.12872  ORF Transcript_4720/g.12872 Transcript_4720/m.12872 type:complete len:177 (-) Transcript_4720:74-604(-)